MNLGLLSTIDKACVRVSEFSHPATVNCLLPLLGEFDDKSLRDSMDLSLTLSEVQSHHLVLRDQAYFNWRLAMI
jgi:hypothetical protein